MKERIEIGTVAIDYLGRPYTGGKYSAGAKVYKTAPLAKAALGHSHDITKFQFLSCFIEIDREPAEEKTLEGPIAGYANQS